MKNLNIVAWPIFYSLWGSIAGVVFLAFVFVVYLIQELVFGVFIMVAF